MAKINKLRSPISIKAKKQFGQNFLQGTQIPEEIVKKSGVGEGDIVLEIGPGLGALTIPLAKVAKKVIAIEKDMEAAEELTRKLTALEIQNVTLHRGDILSANLQEISEEAGQRLFVFGNLPYHISSLVLGLLANNAGYLRKATLMFQKELADRLIAEPGTKTYSRISVLCQFYGNVAPLLFVGAKHFFPKPKVDSQVVSISFYHPNPHLRVDTDFFFKVVQASFGQRRKNLKNALLGSALEFSPKEIQAAFEKTSISPSRRAETLSIDEFILLAQTLYKTGKHKEAP